MTIFHSPDELQVWLDLHGIKILGQSGVHGHGYRAKDTFEDTIVKCNIGGYQYLLLSSKQCVRCLNEAIRINEHKECTIKIDWFDSLKYWNISITMKGRQDSWEEITFANKDQLYKDLKKKIDVLELLMNE